VSWTCGRLCGSGIWNGMGFGTLEFTGGPVNLLLLVITSAEACGSPLYSGVHFLIEMYLQKFAFNLH